jgi:hypothetical protein
MAILPDIRIKVRELLGDAPSNATSWSDAQIDAAINQACLDYCVKTGVSYIEESVPVNDGSILLPVGAISVQRVIGLDRTTKEFEDLRNPQWRYLDGPSLRWMYLDGRRLLLTPRNSYSADIGYLQSPDLLAQSGNWSPDSRIPVPHHEYLPYAAASFLLLLDGDNQDSQKAAGFMTMFNSLISYR